jgi:hypothetical protein
MLKCTILFVTVVGACALDVETDTVSSQSTETKCDAGSPPPPPPGVTCTERGVTVSLDDAPANIDHFDGKVTFCHATSSATNPFVVITTSVNACFAHVQHEHLEKGGELDVFSGGVCAD